MNFSAEGRTKDLQQEEDTTRPQATWNRAKQGL